MLTVLWYVTVWDGANEIDHIFFNGDEPQSNIIQYMLERVYGAKQYEFAKDVEDGADVIVDHSQGHSGQVEIYCTNHIPDISIQKKRATAVLDLGYTPHKMNIVEQVGKEAEKLWAELGDIPINEDEEIDVDWHIFSKGTAREYIWHWFEDTYNVSVAKDMMKLEDRYQKLIDAFDDVEVIEGDIKVAFTYIGEGLSGEYGESENDYPCLRFDIYEKDYVDYGSEHPDWNWDAVESGSYCTTISIETPKEIVKKMAKYILDEVKDNIDGARSIRHVAAGLSHITEQTVKGM
jgi:hypothetical protein